MQNLRREKGFEIEETISVSLRGSPRIISLLRGRWGEYFKAEVLARELHLDGETGAADAESGSILLDGEELWVRAEPLGKVGPE
jgi:isoleucyl-tRNA synthetase